MSGIRRFFLLNAMLAGTIAGGVIGICAVTLASHFLLPARMSGGDSQVVLAFHLISYAIFIPATVLVLMLYEKPLRGYLAELEGGGSPPEELRLAAGKRLLNQPFFVVAMCMAMWAIGTPVLAWLMHVKGASWPQIALSILDGLKNYLIASTLIFFILERVMQRWLVPRVFPKGDLDRVQGVLRINLKVRFLALFVAINFLPLAAVMILLASGNLTGAETRSVNEAIIFVSSVALILGAGLTLVVAGNLRRAVSALFRVLYRVTKGDFNSKVMVTTNDEIGYAGLVINRMSAGLADRERIKEAFGKYVTEQIRDEILSGRIPLDGEMKEVTLLFADLRDFTGLTERHPPKTVVKVINEYFDRMTGAIEEHGGLVLQYVGDEIEAAFGAPAYMEGHAGAAVAAACEMGRRLTALNQSLADRGLPTLRHGIGIHSGQALAANIGSRGRVSYALVGDTVNLAARLQELTKQHKVTAIISAEAATRLSPDDLATCILTPLPRAVVRGRREPVAAFAMRHLEVRKGPLDGGK